LSRRVGSLAAIAVGDKVRTPAAAAAQGMGRGGAPGCGISRWSSEEEAETRKETGAAGVKDIEFEVLIAHIHR